MPVRNSQDELVKEFTDRLMPLLMVGGGADRRTFGFEYEFLSREPIDLTSMAELFAFLPTCGFVRHGEYFNHDSGVRIGFEPGGQIEYVSPPLTGDERSTFQRFLELIEETNGRVEQMLGIAYLAVGFIPDRAHSPLCLSSERYLKLHARMPECGTRGREMMKGTASVHLHVGIKDPEEMLRLFLRLVELSTCEDLRMSPERRDIWNNTDPTRCGMPSCNFQELTDSRDLCHELVRFALQADDIGENVPFMSLEGITFDGFLSHLTTIFTDIRLNMKGPSLELRTPDSIPSSEFEEKWDLFVNELEKV